MSEKISDYTADATSNPIKNEDLLDFSNEDGAGDFDVSKKITVDEFKAFLNIINLYIADGSLLGNRTVSSGGFFTKFEQGDVIVKVVGESVDQAFLVQGGGGNEVARFGYDQTTQSAVFKLENLIGVFLEANDGVLKVNTDVLFVDTSNVGIGTDAPDSGSKLDIEVPNGSVDPLGMYENRVGGASAGDTMDVSFFFNDSAGTRTEGVVKMTARVDNAPTAGDVKQSLTIGEFKIQPSGRMIVTPNAESAAANAQFEIRGDASSANETLLLRSSGTSSRSVLLIRNLSNQNLVQMQADGKNIFNSSKKTTGDFQVKGLVDDNLLYADASVDSVGMGTNTPSNKSILDLTSTSRGFLKPRMSTIQRDAIILPPAGLEVYNLTTNKMNFFNGTIWEVITSS